MGGYKGLYHYSVERICFISIVSDPSATWNLAVTKLHHCFDKA